MSTAFKEWSGICALIRDGRQSLIVRKGGIAEGRKGFDFNQPAFFLFPTLFHQEGASTTGQADSPEPQIDVGEDGKPSAIEVDTFATLVTSATLRDWDQVAKLQPFHFWTEEVIRERFDYEDAKGLDAGAVSVALIRAHRLPDPVRLPYLTRYGGCRSWVDIDLPAPDLASLAPAVEESVHERLEESIHAILAEDQS